HAFALMPDQMKKMVDAIRMAEIMLGSSVKRIEEAELELRKFAHRGVQALSDIEKGDAFQIDINIGILRPGKQPQGVHPRYLPDIEGKKARRNIPAGHGIQWGDW